LGRVTPPVAQRAALLAAFARSGLSGPAFAAQVGVKYQTFATWRQQWQRRRRGPAVPASVPVKTPPPVRWVEAVVAEPGAAPVGEKSSLVVEFGSGVRVVLNAVEQVALAAALVRAVGPVC